MNNKINRLQEILFTFGWDNKAILRVSTQARCIIAQPSGLFTLVAASHIATASHLAWGMGDMHNDDSWIIATDLEHYIAFYQGEAIAEGLFSYEGDKYPLSLLLNKEDTVDSNTVSYINETLLKLINPKVTNQCLKFLNNLRVSIGHRIAEQMFKVKGVDAFSDEGTADIETIAWEITDYILEQKISALVDPKVLLKLTDLLLEHSISDPLISDFARSQFIGPIFARHLGFAYELSLARHLQFRINQHDDSLSNFTDSEFVSRSFYAELVKSTKKRESGVYYTPNDVVHFMSMNTVFPLVKHVNLQLEGASKLAMNEAAPVIFNALKYLENITILDPSVGCGGFLVESLGIISNTYRRVTLAIEKLLSPEVLSELSASNHRKAKLSLKKMSNPFLASIENNLHGLDIDPRARKYCTLNLVSHCFHSSNAKKMIFSQMMAVIEKKVLVANTIIAAAPLTSSMKKNSRIKEPQLTTGKQEGEYNRIEDLFPNVFKRSPKGFSVIIGNPPYHKLSTQERQVALEEGYLSTGTGDIYSLFIEAMITHLNLQRGSCCMIVPLSLAFSKKLTPLRKLLLEKRGISLTVSHYDNIPGTIFNAGKPESTNSNQANSQRATIFNLNFHSGKNQIKSTNLIRWRSSERVNLFRKINYADVTELCDATKGIPKIGNQALVDFISHTKEVGVALGDLIDDKGSSTLFMPNTARYFIPALTHPLARSGEISFPILDETTRLIVAAAINSNVFYWYWRAFGDGFHVTKSLVKSFPIPTAWRGKLKNKVVAAVTALLDAERDCIVAKQNASKVSINVNFNKRPDLAKQLDILYLKAFCEKNLKSLDFSKYKSSSYIGYDYEKEKPINE